MAGGAAFGKRYEARFGQAVELNAPFSYDSVYIIVDAMKRASSIDPAKILAVMPATDYTGVLGRIQFNSHGDLRNSVISLYRYVGGIQQLIDVVKL